MDTERSSIRQFSSVLRRFKKPEYTGENRCTPCTVINTGIAIALSLAVAVVSVQAAAVVFGACVVVITLWGYLIPGTPTLVQYLPDRVHEAIGPEHDIGAEETTFDIEETLTGANIVKQCETEDDLCLTGSYREQFRGTLDTLAEESTQRERLAESLSVPTEDIRFEETGRQVSVFVDGVRAGGWRSRAALLADLASEQLLSSWLGRRWDTLSDGDRTQLLVALRSFVETCPECGGEVVPDEDVVKSCCRDDIVSVTSAVPTAVRCCSRVPTASRESLSDR